MIERKIYIEFYWSPNDSEITKSLKEIAVFISTLFRYYLPKIKTKRTQKINVELSRFETPYENIYPVDVMNADIIDVRTRFDFEHFDKLELNAKKELLLITIYQQLKLVFERLEVNTEVLKETYDKVLESDFTLALEPFGGTKLNRNKKIKATVTAEYFIGYVLLSVSFFDKENKMIQKVKLFNTVPSGFIYLQLIQNAKWINNEIFQVFSRTKEFIFNVNVNGDVNTLYNPINETADDLKEKILLLTRGEVFIPN